MTSLASHPARAFGGLVLKDLKDVRLLFTFLVAIDVCIVLFAHLGLREPLEAIGINARPGAAILAVLSMVPVVAELYSVDERSGTAALLRSLPTPRWTSAAAKLMSMTCAVACAVLSVLAVQELVYTLGGADFALLPAGWDSWDRLTVQWTIAALGLVLSFTILTAIVTRNALTATLGTLVAVGGLFGLVAALARPGDHVPWLQDLAVISFLSLSTPLGWLMLVGLIASLTAVRGRLARSTWRRATAALVAPFLVTSAGAVGLTMREAARPPMAFDHPDADLAYVELSPDGRRVALQLQAVEGYSVRQSIWVLDTESWSPERQPSVIPPTRSWLPSAGMVSLGGWSSDGLRVLGLRLNGAGYLRSCFSIDPDGRAPAQISHEELVWESEFHGAPIRLSEDGHGSKRVELLDGSEVEIRCKSFRVPARANHLVFYVDPRGALHRLDRRTGEDETLSIEVSDRSSIWPGPLGRHLVVQHRVRASDFIDLETGRKRTVQRGAQHWSRDGSHFVRFGAPHTAGDVTRWTLVSMDGDELFEPERPIDSLVALEDGRWLARDSRRDALYVLDASGALLRTVRAGRAGD